MSFNSLEVKESIFSCSGVGFLTESNYELLFIYEVLIQIYLDFSVLEKTLNGKSYMNISVLAEKYRESEKNAD